MPCFLSHRLLTEPRPRTTSIRINVIMKDFVGKSIVSGAHNLAGPMTNPVQR